MYLKKIEAQGFKSFANRSVLEFTPGIMGIVGPNGSGKSNVADAVRWVLGEQSPKQLRGSNMQDVIFAGTQLRRPMSYAYVTLTLDNSDHLLQTPYDEIRITRQVYRSGESEYRINDSTCRLRDIYELFYDSGIGKEGYSIIGQGQIDLVLSNKPEERRQMFDEAAGIVKYKKRRDLTNKKLEAEHASLQRVQDILKELEHRLGPLEKQSAKARTYLNLRDELKGLEINAFVLESADLEKRLATVREKLEILSGDILSSNEEAARLRASYEKLSEQNDQLDQTLQDAQKHLSDLRVEKEGYEGQVTLLKERIANLGSSREQNAQRLEEIAAERERIRAEEDSYFAKKNELNLQLDGLDDAISEEEEALEESSDTLRQRRFELDRQNKALLEGLEKKAALSGRREAALRTLEEGALRARELEGVKAEHEQTLAGLKEDEAALTAALSTLESQTADAQEALRKADAAVQEGKAQEAYLQSEAGSLRQEEQILRSRHETLLNLTERYEGYGGSVRRVMEQKERFPGVIGAVADLIHAEKQYETAIEIALGGRIQNVVTDNETTARSLIEYLKSGRYGRVTFLPLTSVRGQKDFPVPAALKEDGVIAPANELVEASPELDGVVRYLLGHILVVRDMDAASRIARKYQYRLHLVTPEGEYFSPGGAISGGAYKNGSNLLGRRRELKELEESIRAKNKEARETERKLAALREELSAKRNARAEAQTLFDRLSLQSASLSAQKKGLEAQIAQLKQTLEKACAEAEAVAARLKAAEEEKRSLETELETLDRENLSLQGESTQFAAFLHEEEEKNAQMTARLEEKRLAFSKLEDQNSFLLENIRRLNAELERLKAQELPLLSVGSDSRAEEASCEAQLEDLAERIRSVAAEIAQEESSLDNYLALREQGRGEQQGFFDSREAIATRLSELDKENNRLLSQEERLQEQIEKQAEYIWNEYALTPSQAEEAKTESDMPLPELRREVNRLRGEIRALGPVNVTALEEYKEVSARYNDMKKQEEDLVAAEKLLLDMIKELEDGMRSRFAEQFVRIQQEFATVFKDLFQGGTGSIALESGTDVLSAGVIINAQPPGKKLQNMMQLSGGEKALTAIALLFAIQNLKPSPFCLLDEIESALDEPNVARFANYLQRLKTTTQFLVITHRRGTMEMADRLYGITMQEKGVSALVSVNLTDPESRQYIDEQDQG